jgi:phosphoribosylanthranilate isomerase
LDIRAMLKTKVKVGKITNLSDARYCAGMGVDMLGFSVGLGHTGIDPKKYKEITEWVSGPDFVLEWDGAEIPGDFEHIIQPYNAGFVEIDARHLKNIPALRVRLIVTLQASDWHVLREVVQDNKNRISYVILTGPELIPPDHALVTEIGLQFPLLLGYGIAENNLDALSTLPIAGISLEGTEESSPGLKDYSHLSEILERLEI